MHREFYLHPPYLWFGGFERKIEETPFALIGVPLEATVTYRPGTKFAPLKIREVSREMETYSLRACVDFEEFGIYDGGDLTLPSTDLKENLKALELVVSEFINEDKRVVVLGGEHTLTLGCLRALAGEPTLVVSFDAHMDLRDEYPPKVKLSHATVMRRISELDNVKLIEVGVRAFSKEELEYVKQGKVKVFYLLEGLPEVRAAIDEVRRAANEVEHVYISIDMDVLDPSIAPGVGSPEPGGLGLRELLYALSKLVDERTRVIDIVEVSPPYDHSDLTSLAAARIVYEVTSLLWRSLKEAKLI